MQDATVIDKNPIVYEHWSITAALVVRTCTTLRSGAVEATSLFLQAAVVAIGVNDFHDPSAYPDMNNWLQVFLGVLQTVRP